MIPNPDHLKTGSEPLWMTWVTSKSINLQNLNEKQNEVTPFDISRKENTTKSTSNTQQGKMNGCVRQSNKKVRAATWHENTQHSKNKNINR